MPNIEPHNLMRMFRITITLCLTCLSLVACNVPLPQSPPNTPYPGTAEPSSLPSSEQIDGFVTQLKDALVAKDITALETLMGEAFTVSYWQSDSGTISVSDAGGLFRDDFLSGAASVTIVSDIEPLSLVPDLNTEPETVKTVVALGWGTNAQDEAILFISLGPANMLAFSRILYARGGFNPANSPEAPAVAEDTLPIPLPLPQGTPIVSEPAPRGNEIYSTQFIAGWTDLSGTYGTAVTVAEGYQMDLSAQALWSITTRMQQSDFYAEIAARPLNCPEDTGAYGLIFHYVSNSQFRAFVVNCNRTWSVYERSTLEGVARALQEGTLPDSLEVQSGEHRIGIRGIGTALDLFVDDSKVGTLTVPDSPSGDFGPYGQSDQGNLMSVIFTSLTIFDAE